MDDNEIVRISKDVTLNFLQKIGANISNSHGVYTVTIPKKYENLFRGMSKRIAFDPETSDTHTCELVVPGSNFLGIILNEIKKSAPVVGFHLKKQTENPKEFFDEINTSNCQATLIDYRINRQLAIRFHFNITVKSIKKVAILRWIDVDLDTMDILEFPWELEINPALGSIEYEKDDRADRCYNKATEFLTKDTKPLELKYIELTRNNLKRDIDSLNQAYEGRLKEFEKNVKLRESKIFNLDIKISNARTDQAEKNYKAKRTEQKALLAKDKRKIKDSVKKLKQDRDREIIQIENRYRPVIEISLIAAQVYSYPTYTSTLEFKNDVSSKQTVTNFIEPSKSFIILCEICKNKLEQIHLCVNSHICCNLCSKQCVDCRNFICELCDAESNTCYICNEILCVNCRTLCNFCSEKTCTDHLLSCPHCNQMTCYFCSESCQICQKRFCEESIQTCNSCKKQFCQTDRTRCAECDLEFCRNDAGECNSCKKQFCQTDRTRCAECDLEFCRNDAGECNSCKKQFCQTDRTRCAECDLEFCRNDAGECNSCKKQFCQTDRTRCAECDLEFCRNDAGECNSCKKQFCQTDRTRCAECDLEFCRNDAGECNSCKKQFCQTDRTRCAECDLEFCRNDAGECNSCKKQFCQTDRTRCAECDLEFCRNDAGECNSCKKQFCQTDRTRCAECDLEFCRNDAGECNSCKKQFCQTDRTRCAECDLEFCRNDAGECNSCKKQFCQTDRTRCAECDLEFCRNDAGECNSCKKQFCQTDRTRCAECDLEFCRNDAGECPICNKIHCMSDVLRCNCCEQLYSKGCVSEKLCLTCTKLESMDKNDPQIQKLFVLDSNLSKSKKWKGSFNNKYAIFKVKNKIFGAKIIVYDKLHNKIIRNLKGKWK